MSDKTIKLTVNAAPLEVELVYPTPWEGEDSYGRPRWGFTFRGLSDHVDLKKGEEGRYFTGSKKIADTLKRFGKGDRIRITYSQAAGERHRTLTAEPIGNGRQPEPQQNGNGKKLDPANPKNFPEVYARCFLLALDTRARIAELVKEQEGEKYPEDAHKKIYEGLDLSILKDVATTFFIQVQRS